MQWNGRRVALFCGRMWKNAVAERTQTLRAELFDAAILPGAHSAKQRGCS
jgi:hypothetical protein